MTTWPRVWLRLFLSEFIEFMRDDYMTTCMTEAVSERIYRIRGRWLHDHGYDWRVSGWGFLWLRLNATIDYVTAWAHLDRSHDQAKKFESVAGWLACKPANLHRKTSNRSIHRSSTFRRRRRRRRWTHLCLNENGTHLCTSTVEPLSFIVDPHSFAHVICTSTGTKLVQYDQATTSKESTGGRSIWNGSSAKTIIFCLANNSFSKLTNPSSWLIRTCLIFLGHQFCSVFFLGHTTHCQIYEDCSGLHCFLRFL